MAIFDSPHVLHQWLRNVPASASAAAARTAVAASTARHLLKLSRSPETSRTPTQRERGSFELMSTDQLPSRAQMSLLFIEPEGASTEIVIDNSRTPTMSVMYVPFYFPAMMLTCNTGTA